MTLNLQDPATFNALRKAFDLAGQTSRMSMADEIVPVAVVRDITELMDSPYDYVTAATVQPAVPAEHSFAVLSQSAFASDVKKRLYVDRIRLTMSAAGVVFLSMKQVAAPGVPQMVASARRYTDRLGTMQGQVAQGSTALAPSFGNQQQVVVVPTTELIVDFPMPWVLDIPGTAALVVTTEAQNITLRATFEWREDRRP